MVQWEHIGRGLNSEFTGQSRLLDDRISKWDKYRKKLVFWRMR